MAIQERQTKPVIRAIDKRRERIRPKQNKKKVDRTKNKGVLILNNRLSKRTIHRNKESGHTNNQ